MAIGDDFSITSAGDIRHTGGASTYTVLELHRWLQDLADDSSSMGDDLVDIVSDNPSDRATDQILTLNGTYNIDDDASEYFYGGSVSQTGGDTLYSGLQVLGSVNAATTQLQIVQNNTLLTNFWGTGVNNAGSVLLRILVKSRVSGADIDGKRIRVQAREYGDYFDSFNVTLGQGESVAAISTTLDAQNDTAISAVSAYSDVTNTEGFQLLDLDNGNGNREYYSKWTYGALDQKALWEWSKYVQHRATTETIHGMNGELFQGITHSWNYNNELSGPYTEDEVLSWSTGTGVLLALDDDGTTGNLYIQLTTGIAPVSGASVSGVTSLATSDVSGTPDVKIISNHLLGLYTGSFIGAYGVGMEPTELTSNDSVQDLASVTQTPPNNVSVTVTSVVSGDRVLLARDDTSGAIEEDTYTLSGANTSGATTIAVNEAINNDDPSFGKIRVWNSSQFDVYNYASYSGSVFTLSGAEVLSQTYTSGDNVFVPFIDEQATGTSVSKTIKYSSDINVVGRVRNGGASPIKPFPITGIIGSAGFSVSTIRTSDE